MPVLFKNEYVVISRLTGSNVVCVKRTSLQSSGIAHVEEAERILRSLFPLAERPQLVLLNDQRDAPMPMDAEQERQMQPIIRNMVGGFARLAVLIRTPVGKLQARRLSVDLSAERGVFDDEEAAYQFLSRPLGPGKTS